MNDVQVSQGWLDNQLKKWILDALGNASFDYKKFLGHAKTKEAAVALSVSLKESAYLPFDIDDKGIDMALAALEALLDQYKNQGKLVVGSTGGEPVYVITERSRKEVEDELRKVGIDPLSIGFLLMSILMKAPDIIAFIKKIFGK